MSQTLNRVFKSKIAWIFHLVPESDCLPGVSGSVHIQPAHSLTRIKKKTVSIELITNAELVIILHVRYYSNTCYIDTFEIQ